MSERRPRFRFAPLVALVLFASLSVLSCSSDGGGPTTPSISTGSVAVSVGTSGPDAPASFTAALDGGTPRTVDANGSTSFASVGGGDHTVTLGDIPDNCTVGGTNPRSTTVAAGQTANVAFSVTCVGLTGSLELTTETTGDDLDPDGYEVEIDGGVGLAIGASETLAPQVLATGDHDVELTGMAANCVVAGANPRTVTVETDETVSTTFEVTCNATTGAIEITTTTTGPDIDADGYTVDLDGESNEAADANGTVTFSGVSEGAHSLTLGGIAANCTVTGDNPVAATVVVGETAAVAFDLTCTDVNFAPIVTISSPDTTSTVAPLYVAPGDAVTFTGAATDPEDGSLTGGSLVWVSNVDGQIGTGETFMTSSLSEGQHAVRLTATDSEFEEDTETVLVIVNPPPAAGYQIALRLADGTTLTPGQQTAIDDAIVKLESIVTGDVPDLPTAFAGFCGPTVPVLDETVDDLVIYLAVQPIDGPGGILGQAGPCWVRGGSFLPAVGIMTFDSADLANLEIAGQVDEVLLHEAMHVMGFGTIWSAPGLDFLQDQTGQNDDPPPDTYFSGAAAITQFGVVGGGSYTGGNVVPVENDNDTFGGGSLNAHWRESVFAHELMTPAINGGSNPLSVVTVGQFEDLGYTVDYGEADAYIHVFTFRAQGGAPLLDLHDDVWRGPLWAGDASGNARRIR